METQTNDMPTAQAAPDVVKPSGYSQVSVRQEDTIGAIFLGLVSLTLLFAYFRAEARNRGLLANATAR